MTDPEREEQRLVLERLSRDAARLAGSFRLPLQSLQAERPQVKRRYGVCYEDGSIRVRLRHTRTGRLLKYSSLVDTLCHELAHLRYFHHGQRFRRFYLRLLERARRLGIYRPDPRRPAVAALKPQRFPARAAATPRAQQLDLFPRPSGSTRR